jgi:hypothetical protein
MLGYFEFSYMFCVIISIILANYIFDFVVGTQYFIGSSGEHNSFGACTNDDALKRTCTREDPCCMIILFL